MAGTSEATIKRHYREVLTPEVGKAWFKIGANFNGSEVIRDQKETGHRAVKQNRAIGEI